MVVRVFRWISTLFRNFSLDSPLAGLWAVAEEDTNRLETQKKSLLMKAINVFMIRSARTSYACSTCSVNSMYGVLAANSGGDY